SLAVPPAAVRALRAAIRRVRHALPAADAGWGRHATAHLDALRRCFRLEALLDEEVQVAEAIRDVLATLARLDALGETIPRAAFVEASERECRRRRLGAPAPRGVAIVAIPRSDRAKRGLGEIATPRELLRAAPDASAALAAFGFDAFAFDRARAFLAALDGEREVSAFEGRVGPLAPEWMARSIGRLSPTRLERFATCPFRYFAEEVLKILPADDVVEGEDLSPREIGKLMHSLLERLYGRLAARDLHPDHLGAELAQAMTDVAAEFERQAHLPLRGVLRARFAEIVRAVEAFAAFDLATLGDWEPVWFEERATVPFAELVLAGQ